MYLQWFKAFEQVAFWIILARCVWCYICIIYFHMFCSYSTMCFCRTRGTTISPIATGRSFSRQSRLRVTSSAILPPRDCIRATPSRVQCEGTGYQNYIVYYIKLINKYPKQNVQHTVGQKKRRSILVRRGRKWLNMTEHCKRIGAPKNDNLSIPY